MLDMRDSLLLVVLYDLTWAGNLLRDVFSFAAKKESRGTLGGLHLAHYERPESIKDKRDEFTGYVGAQHELLLAKSYFASGMSSFDST